MSITRVFHCDSQSCDTHIKTTREYPTEGVSLTERNTATELWACSWDCVLAIAGTVPPSEVIQ